MGGQERIDRQVGEAGRAIAEGRLEEGSRLLASVLKEARVDRHPRATDVAVMLARLVLVAGRPAEALEILAGVAADEAGRSDIGRLRAQANEALGRFDAALLDWASMPAPDADEALDGRLRAHLALGNAAEAGALLESALAGAAAGGREAEVLRLQSMQAALWLEAGRTGDALATWREVARKAKAAGAAPLGLQARVHIATYGESSPAARSRSMTDLVAVRGEAVELADPTSYALACAALGDLQVAAGLDPEAADTVFRARAALADLLGDAGMAIGDAMVRRVSKTMGGERWERALDGFIAARKAGKAVQDA